ncbi:hypothetical protein WA158_001224 [Blastocystis sp. Blastoise]
MPGVIEIHDDLEIQLQRQKGKLCVVDFYAQWCQPCKMMHPIFDNFAGKYSTVAFFRVDSDENQRICSEKGIRALPTFHFYINGDLKDQLQGYNPSGVESKIIELMQSVKGSFSGSGMQLSSDGPRLDEQQMKEARLKKFKIQLEKIKEQKKQETKVIPTLPIVTPEKKVFTPSLSMTPDRQNTLNSLLEMGFSEVKIRKALSVVGSDLDSCITYLAAEQDQEDSLSSPSLSPLNNNNNNNNTEHSMDIDNHGDNHDDNSAGLAPGEKMVCDGNMCRIVKDTAPEMTFEEKQEEIKRKIAQRKAQKEEEEKRKAIEEEKKRRQEGKKLNNQLDEFSKIIRQQEAEKRRQDKIKEENERERQLRLWNEEHGIKTATPKEIAIQEKSIEEKLDGLINGLRIQRVNEMGRNALKTLHTIIKNTFKDDPKYYRIKADNNTLKTKLVPAFGAIQVLTLSGFQLQENEYVLVNRNLSLLKIIMDKLDAAVSKP